MFYCEWCDIEITEEEAEIRVEDNTFSAPMGDLKVVIGGSIDKIAVCPECGFDLEEVV
jgi:hypothetical protein